MIKIEKTFGIVLLTLNHIIGIEEINGFSCFWFVSLFALYKNLE